MMMICGNVPYVRLCYLRTGDVWGEYKIVGYVDLSVCVVKC